MTTEPSGAWRRGLGTILPLVVITLGCVLVFTIATSLTGSTVGRTASRVSDLRMLASAGQSALTEASLAIKRALASGAASPYDWRAELLPPQTPGGKAIPRPPPVKPVSSKSQYKGFGIDVGDVDVTVVRWEFPPATSAAPDFPDFPAQGVLELRVTCEAKRAYYTVKRTLKQRRVYYLTFDAWPLTGPPDPAKVFYVLENSPIATTVMP